MTSPNPTRIGVCLFIVSVTLAAPAAAQLEPQTTAPRDALELIESTRGGRHWVDQKTAPPLSPEASLKRLHIDPTLEVSLYAAEPTVLDPVAITFDTRGRMFVVEYGDYPTGPAAGEPPLSRVVLIEDTDDDGRADRRTVFADHLDFCHSVMPYQDGLLVCERTQISLLVDSDGDRVADRRETLFRGFAPAHPQMQIGNPRWGIDNQVYCNYGPGNVSTARVPDQVTRMPRNDFCFDPATLAFRPDGGWGQFGNTIDRWGTRYYCTNRNPVITTALDSDVAKRNPFHTVANRSYDVAASGGASRVFPLIEMKSNYLSHSGTHTAACGVTAYLGNRLGKDPQGRTFQDNVFVCEPIGHLITRTLINRDGARLIGERAEATRDFMASTDPWFRPASLATGPNGALYVADMYRLWVEHPKFLPPEIAAKLDWRAGDDRGRIYRIVAKQDAPEHPFSPPDTTTDLLKLLDSQNGWRQRTAQQGIIERHITGKLNSDENDSLVSALTDRMLHADSATTRLRSLWTLHGIASLSDESLIAAFSDSDWHLRRDALRIARSRTNTTSVCAAISKLAEDSDPEVRRQVALAIGNAPDASVVAETLKEILKQDFSRPLTRDAVLTASERVAGALLHDLSEHPSFGKAPDRGRIGFVETLAKIVAARGNAAELNGVVTTLLSENDDNVTWFHFAAVAGWSQGLSQHRGEMGQTNLARFIESPPEDLRPASDALASWLERSRSVAFLDGAPLESRVAAIGLMAGRTEFKDLQPWKRLLDTGQPPEVQSAAVDALARRLTPQRTGVVLDTWDTLSPQVRSHALGKLLLRTESSRLVLHAMRGGKISTARLGIDQRVRLLKHADDEIRSMATALLGGAVSPDRRGVVEKYGTVFKLNGDAKRGNDIFGKTCAACHRIGNVGHNLGPDLSDSRNRSLEALLYDILDPNSKVEPQYAAYSVLTKSGNVLSGLVADDSGAALTLKMAENKSVTIPRDEIESVKSSNVSLMPEGIEKEVTPQQMADLLAFLLGR